MAQKILREHQPSWLLAVGRDRKPVGMVWEDDVARAVREGRKDLPFSKVHEMPIVHRDTPINELFEHSAKHLAPLVVTDDAGRVEGVIPRVTLLTAATPVVEQDVDAQLEGANA